MDRRNFLEAMVGSAAAAPRKARAEMERAPPTVLLSCRSRVPILKLHARAVPWMAGGVIWHQFDFEGETCDTVVPHVNAFGMADMWRIPKDAYYFYQSQWSPTPMVHIAGHWTWPGEEGQPRRSRSTVTRRKSSYS